MSSLAGARVLLGVGGGIAAYKSALLLRGLVGEGAQVQVIPTRSSLEFVGAATWEALSHNKVLTSVFEHVDEVAHVRIGQDADLVVIAPATADLLARMRAGRADDLLTASLLVTRAPVVIAPAMHTEMWEHPATVENVAVLRERGLIVLEPAVGRLTGPDSGPGRLPEPTAILDAARAAIAAPRTALGGVQHDLSGRHLLISAGGTREELDPVRFLANHSSGRQGWALAHAALARGARVTLAAANVDLETPPGADRRDVTSAAQLASLVAEQRERADAVIMAAAVADFTAAQRSEAKIKKTDNGDSADGAAGADDAPSIPLRRTEDVLRTTVTWRGDGQRPAIVGFAAETGGEGHTAFELAQQKARRKGADLLVFNDVTAGVFGSADNAVRILDADGEQVASAEGSKTEVAHAVLDELVRRLPDVPLTA
ncbi:bifunctional phosphopantothenoylcysteine decarboxylase/phosphopantothenate--cysteine ligase CoaBC [Brachybacterium muris]|uniref:bifunctional phosphopantothenoylcysteine decarboxylase/phosphopantothenate--cysteine ligase CoaBC n=1 Tax=Brachybacterium muris TaxID=219301 RepID=UPI0021A47015|nr:bifunctional phosphopantothenoylcysteine decarboxylase/phosphopantothenate--cysteine ligase CoaBC [Brachybacterium muris]MCT1998280.1 bifunctional phosphopantothenoylcysteine decarboxylase/phosphopantothenate--cysteine ligase CoaBC [Brachybacterium muris]